ncbi:hypothetical protein ACIGXM_33160 [Kitasatospora sp. NPDC052896]|uniref:hypothetical protein n=1 Tax=Kitasatospora sp. NPDC052896 TaxID=3364061 RepID=UPI0037CBA878
MLTLVAVVPLCLLLPDRRPDGTERDRVSARSLTTALLVLPRAAHLTRGEGEGGPRARGGGLTAAAVSTPVPDALWEDLRAAGLLPADVPVPGPVPRTERPGVPMRTEGPCG